MSVIYPENPGPGDGPRIKPSLTDFLLARLDEYERDIDEVTSGFYDAPMSAEQMWADLDAKRRIVETCGIIADDPTLPSHHLARHVLADLALPYADHPEYRSGWAP